MPPTPILLQRRYFWSATVFAALALLSLVLLMINNGHKAAITLTPAQADIGMDWDVSVANQAIAEAATNPNIIAGQVLRASLQSPAPVATTPDSKSKGTVVIHNENGRPQTLVATTRFLNEANVLFRLSKEVTVPANGTVSAELVADKPGPTGDVAPGKMTIPGLSSAMQKKVYGVTDKAFTGGGSQKPGDIAIAEKSTWQDAATTYFKNTIQPPFSLVPESLTKMDENGSAVAYAVAIDLADTKQRALQMLEAKLPVGYSLAEDSIALSVKRADFSATDKTASITFTAHANIAFNPSDIAIDWSKVLGVPTESARSYLASIPGVKEVTVDMQPSWRQTMPNSQRQVILLGK